MLLRSERNESQELFPDTVLRYLLTTFLQNTYLIHEFNTKHHITQYSESVVSEYKKKTGK